MKRFVLFLFLIYFCNIAFSQINLCKMAIPLCLNNDSISFPAAANTIDASAGPNYGCLQTLHNPTWFFFQASKSGAISLSIHGVTADIDYICWGPFAEPFTPCSSQISDINSIIDCSYSALVNELCQIPNADSGAFYILLITNYNNIASNVTIAQTNSSDSTGAINCDSSNIYSKSLNVCAKDTIYLQSVINDPTAQYTWVFANGDSSFVQNPIIPNIDSTYYGQVINKVITATDTIYIGGIIAVKPLPKVKFKWVTNWWGCFSFTNQSINYDSLVWNFGDDTISLSENPLHCYEQNGIYIVTLNAYLNGCKNTKQDTLEVSVGISNNLINNFTVKPNPASDYIDIEVNIFDSQQNLEIDLMDISGRILINQMILTKKTSLNISNFKKGIYILKIHSSQQTNFVKFVKM